MARPPLQKVCSGSIRGTQPDPSANSFPQRRRQILNSDAFLLHRIAIAQRDCVAQSRIFFPESLEINGDTERGTYFVLPAIPPTNRAALVVEDGQVWAQEGHDLLRFRDERLLVFEQGKYCALDRCDPRMKT